MFSTLRNRFGIPGVISVIALVFAMFGGAYAASSSSGGGKATASAKAKKGPRGPKGATGPAGPAGPTGPAGPQGAKGDAGANGSNGSNGKDGTNGANGTSVVASNEATGTANCGGRGGSKFVTGATTTFACNGKEGAGGGGGGGWSKTLPPGETETGAWWVTGQEETFESEGKQFSRPVEVQATPISFPIPLSVSDAASITPHYAGSNGDATCTGTAAAPAAPPGTLCLYISDASNLSTQFLVSSTDFVTEGVGPSGALLWIENLPASKYEGGGFAITAPSS